MGRLIVFSLLLVCLRVSADNIVKRIDSLKALMVHADDTTKIRLLNNIAKVFDRETFDHDSAAFYAKASIEFQKRINTPLQYIISANVLAHHYFILGNTDSSLAISYRGLGLAEKFWDIDHKYLLLRTIANTYNFIGKTEFALDYYLKALSVAEQNKDSLRISESYSSIGNFYINNNNFDLAQQSHRASLAILLSMYGSDSVSFKHRYLANAYSNLGSLMIRYYTNKLKPIAYVDSALFYFNKGIYIVRKIDDKLRLLNLLINTSDAYNIKGNYINAIDLLMEASDEIARTPNNYLNVCIWINLGDAYRGLNNINVSLQYLQKALELAKGSKLNNDITSEAYHSFAKTYEKAGRYNEAYENYKTYSEIKDTILNFQSAEAISEMLARYETSKKDAEILLLTKDSELKQQEIGRQKSVRNIVLFGLLLITVLSFLLLGRYRITKRLNNELDKMNSLIYNKNRLIMDSIDYAERIQRLILPPMETVCRHLADSFVVYIPKDVISGDTYWFTKQENIFLLTAIDCTGHGVPGALMSMVAYNLLNRSVGTGEKPDAVSVITNMNKGLKNFLARPVERSSVRDGMDIAVCSIDLNTLQLTFAGAQNSVYIVRKRELTELKAENVSMGDPVYFDHIFSGQVVQLNKGDWVYLFTDGYADQKGGPNNKKFYYQPFKEMITGMNDLNGTQQKKNLEDVFYKWKERNEQVDDVLVIGIKI
ncbi:MAG: tetratricopeptide repeat protein [Bacteroidetes bacterium]|nr:tetratricopeptide repeat protein [Bacteroidota bacterium]